MTDKHHVIVPGAAVWPYLASGYQRSAESAEALLGSGWQLLSDPERKDLVVLEIDQEQHEQLNQNPRRHGVARLARYNCYAVEPRTYELLEKEDDAPDDTILVAQTDRDAPLAVPKKHLHLTAQGAALAAVPYVREQIEEHKAAIASLETFLRQHT